MIADHTPQPDCLADEDFYCYEMFCGRLSRESKSLLQRHLSQCPGCHRRIRRFIQTVQDVTVVRNYG
jgi:hypothetical protein